MMCELCSIKDFIVHWVLPLLCLFGLINFETIQYALCHRKFSYMIIQKFMKLCTLQDPILSWEKFSVLPLIPLHSTPLAKRRNFSHSWKKSRSSIGTRVRTYYSLGSLVSYHAKFYKPKQVYYRIYWCIMCRILPRLFIL